MIPYHFSVEGTAKLPDERRLESAPSTPWHKNSCVTDALKIGGLTIGDDAIGLIPEGGGAKTIARGIGHWSQYRGIVADNFGKKVIQQAKVGGGTFSVSQGVAWEDWTSTGLAVAGFIPVLGQYAAIGSIINDTHKTVNAIGQCR